MAENENGAAVPNLRSEYKKAIAAAMDAVDASMNGGTEWPAPGTYREAIAAAMNQVDARYPIIGATGNFPDGKVSEDDEGEIQFGMAADPDNEMVHIDFGKPVAWLRVPGQDAITIAVTMLDKAIVCAGAKRPIAEFVTDEVKFLRAAHQVESLGDGEVSFRVDMGYWTLRAVVDPRGLVELRRQVMEWVL